MKNLNGKVSNFTSKFYRQEMELMEKDQWKAEEIGHEPDSVHGVYHLNFRRLEPEWFKIAVKKYVRFQSATKSFASCYSYIVGLIHFWQFIVESYADISSDKIDRKIIVNYIQYLAKSQLGITSRGMALTHLRTFHGITLQEKWLGWTREQLIYSSDIPKTVEKIPRFIPEYVIVQLHQFLPSLPLYMQRLIIILLETGRRIGEICTLPVDCMERDKDGDYFLRVYERKLKKFNIIPISDICIKEIEDQQKSLKCHKEKKWLFPAARNCTYTPHVSSRNVNASLNKLAKQNNIKDENGNLWNFHTHQFRHTVGTRMINSGVPQVIVQKYLGHESSDMTARYAHIHDETLKKAFNEYQDKFVNIYGKPAGGGDQEKYKEAKWLSHNLMTQALPNGVCALSCTQQRCPHANACLTCVNFRTHKKFLPQHRVQLQATNEIIEASEKNGWGRQLEMNLAVKKNLEMIIKNIEEE